MRYTFIQCMLWLAMIVFLTGFCSWVTGCAASQKTIKLANAALDLHDKAQPYGNMLQSRCNDLQEQLSAACPSKNEACAAVQKTVRSLCRDIDRGLYWYEDLTDPLFEEALK